MVDSLGDNYLMVAPGSNHRVTPERVAAAEDDIASCDWVVLQMEIPIPANVAALDLAARHGKAVLMNYAPAHDLAMPRDARIHGLVVNESEAAALLGCPFDPANRAAARDAAATLRSAGHAFAIVTLGAGGVAVCDDSGARDFPAFVVTPCDATAAGDTFCGALATALGEGRGLDEAVFFASAAAALAVSRAGAQPSIPSRAEIDAFLTRADS
jgi:ribokinase